MAKGLHKATKAEVPVKTGALKRSLANKKVSKLQRHIVEQVPHGKLLRSGSPKHEIWPRRPAYALWWDGAGFPRAMVNHPGFKKVEYNLTAVKKSQGLIDDVASQIGERITVSLTRDV